MLDAIRNDPDLFSLLRGTCAENGILAQLAPSLRAADGGIEENKGLVLKIDAYYCPPRFAAPPPAIDCLVVVKCDDGDRYAVYLIELRNTIRTALVRGRDIRPKFDTTARDFIGVRFAHVFRPYLNQIASVRAFLATDPLGLSALGLSDEEYKSRIRGSVLDAYAQLAPIECFDRLVLIEPVPSPLISPC